MFEREQIVAMSAEYGQLIGAFPFYNLYLLVNVESPREIIYQLVVFVWIIIFDIDKSQYSGRFVRQYSAYAMRVG